MAAEPAMVLRRKLKRALAGGHPWIYRDAVTGPTPPPGTIVRVTDERGRFVARGLSEPGPIALRVLTTVDEPIDEALLARRIEDAVALRRRVLPPQTDVFRLVHGEGDRLPGVVCDVYGSCATLSLDGAAATAWRERWLAALRGPLSEYGVESVLVRTGRRGQRVVEPGWGAAPPPTVTVTEHGLRLVVDLHKGQKTGMFIDHRAGRHRIRGLADGARVLDLYAYIGGFSAGAGLGGAASVTTVDVAAGAIAMAEKTWQANALPPERQTAVAADVPEFLEQAQRRGERYDVIIADPPSFAPNAASVRAALRSYAKLHRACLRLLADNGWLLAATCSSHVDAATFDGVLAEAAAKERRPLQVVGRWGAPEDHPRIAAFPEGDYLAVVLARALS